MELNNNNMKKILAIITFAVLLFVGVQNINLVLGFLLTILNLIFPFLLGAGIAFILNVPMKGIENGIFNKINKKKSVILKLKRPISLVLTLICALGIIFLVVFLIVPEIVQTIYLIGEKSPAFFKEMRIKTLELMDQFPEVADYINEHDLDWYSLGEGFVNFLRNSGKSMVQSTFGIASSIIGGLIDFFLGLIFSIYILLQKEKLGQQIRKVMYAYLPQKLVDKVITVATLSSHTFSKFLSGQGLEAVILGALFFLSMSILNFPYALMIGILIGFTALIPIFGAFVGCFIGTFLIVMVDPMKALWFVILFLILQQIEGNFIYPRVVGGSIGLPSIWVLFAVSIGGSTMGVAGMLIFIPLASVCYTLLRDAVSKRLKERNIPVTKYRP